MFDQVHLEYYHVQEDENEPIIRIKEEGGFKDQKFLSENYVDIDGASELVAEVLSESEMDFNNLGSY